MICKNEFALTAGAGSAHTFHIPVMGTGFTIDTPLKVAKYGISSVVSVVDDMLIEQVRKRVCQSHGMPYLEIAADEEDSRARRITAYLDLLHEIVQRQIEQVKQSVFEAGSEIVRYFELLPDSPARDLYLRMKETLDERRRQNMQERLRAMVKPGAIDVNIMTKLDRDHDRSGKPYAECCSDALTALRGFLHSKVDGSVVLSAGMNARLFAYMGQFRELLPDSFGDLRKRIVLKVADYRSAMLQGKKLARLGLHVSEFRIESGLNCGGHAFGGKGQLMGPILESFRNQRAALGRTLSGIRRKALEALGHREAAEPAEALLTVQGGIGNAEEDRLLRDHYGVDRTGWGSPFLYAPDVVNIDGESLRRLQAAGEEEIVKSGASPLGVPFWSLASSTSEDHRRSLVTDGRPGSDCPKGFLVFNSEFTKRPICTATTAYQRRKTRAIQDSELAEPEKHSEQEAVHAKACLCRDLAASYTATAGIEPDLPTAVCCGPNAAYYAKQTDLHGMVDHIYGRKALPMDENRPHMFLKELGLNLSQLREDLTAASQRMSSNLARRIEQCQENLEAGIQHYRELAERLVAPSRERFRGRLEELQAELQELMGGGTLQPVKVAVPTHPISV